MQRHDADELGVAQQRLGGRDVEFAQPVEASDTSIKGPICGRAERSKQSRTGVMDPESSQIDQDPGMAPSCGEEPR